MKSLLLRSRKLHIFLLSLLAVDIVTMVMVFRKTLAHKSHLDTSQRAVISNLGMKPDAIVPLYADKDGVAVDVVLNGHKVRSLVDTGTATVIWPASLKLTSEKTELLHSISPGDTYSFHSLSTVKIGAVTLRHVPSLAYEYSKPPLPPHSLISETTTLGNSAFADTVLAIDTRNKYLYLYADPAKVQHFTPPPDSLILPFQRIMQDEKWYGLLSIPLILEGFDARAILDTGNSNMLWIGHSFFRRNLRQHPLTPATATTAFDTHKIWTAADIHFQLKSIRNARRVEGKTIAGIGVRPDIDGVDANVGIEALRSAVVIINYPKQEIYLYYPDYVAPD